MQNPKTTHILAVASKGGHWDQMCQLASAFNEADAVDFATTDIRLAELRGIENAHEIADYSQSEPMKMLRGLRETFHLIRSVRPTVVISTGAAPGLLCLLWGKIFGAKTIWIDSIANAEKLSLSGRLASRFACLTLTQWETLANGKRVQFAGSVL